MAGKNGGRHLSDSGEFLNDIPNNENMEALEALIGEFNVNFVEPENLISGRLPDPHKSMKLCFGRGWRGMLVAFVSLRKALMGWGVRRISTGSLYAIMKLPTQSFHPKNFRNSPKFHMSESSLFHGFRLV